MIAPLLLGLLSSIHCIGMCGPIALALPIHTMNATKKTACLMAYHLGRIGIYTFLGALFGTIGKGLFIAGFQQNLSVILGILLIIGVVVMKNKLLEKSVFIKTRYFIRLKSYFGKYLKKKTILSFVVLGSLNGLLPCAMIYMALFGALSTQGTLYGAFFMMWYGLGTIPLLTVVVWVGQWMSSLWKARLQKMIPYLLVVMGIFLIVRGLGLNIPYFSPGALQLFITANPQCIT